MAAIDAVLMELRSRWTELGKIDAVVHRVVHGGERFTTPTLIEGEDVEIDTDPRSRQVVADNDAPVWERMNGVRFKHPIPPYTESCTFNISVTGAPAESLIQLRLPRPWSRPWGLV